MGYGLPKGSLEGACRHESGKANEHLRTLLKGLHDRLHAIERKTGLQAVDQSAHSITGRAPQPAMLTSDTQPGDGVFRLYITNPEFRSDMKLGNTLRTPIYHQVQYCPANDFKSDVKSLPGGFQTYFEISRPNVTMFFRWRSSFDAVTWNEWQVSKAVSS